MKPEYAVVMTTFPDAETAERILAGLLERRLAACVQTLPIHSTYRWKGAVTRSPEVLAMIKTKKFLYPEVEIFLKAAHPYEVPEILLLPATSGSKSYLAWIDAETK